MSDDDPVTKITCLGGYKPGELVCIVAQGKRNVPRTIEITTNQVLGPLLDLPGLWFARQRDHKRPNPSSGSLGSPTGHGRTRQEAINDLKAKLEELEGREVNLVIVEE